MAQSPKAYDGLDRLFLAGEWRDGKGEASENLNPWTGETLFTMGTATEDNVDEAMKAAQKAQVEWAAKPPAERSALMSRIADILEARSEEFAGWIVRESGGTRTKAQLEVGLVTSVFREAAVLPYMVEGRILPEDIPGKESRCYRKPVGVVALISPWNFPGQLTARTLGPALAVGNGVVVKPASDTPVTGGTFFAAMLEEAGLPKGLVSVLPGSGSTVGDALSKHEIPRLISFTGSTPVGRGVGHAAMDSKIIKQLELELGGNGPIVVLDDADLDVAVKASLWGKFMHQGQICMIANRIIIEKGLYDAFTERFVAAAEKLKVGDPDDPETFIGPIINKGQLDNITDLIAKANEEGSRQLLGGDPDGLILPPHIYGDVAEESCLVTNEIFGPVAPLQKADDAEHAIRLANNTTYGLSSSVFTQDIQKGLKLAQRIEAGMTHINDQPVNDSPFGPFGGEKNSGLGRFNGRWAVDAFTTDHWITIQHEPRDYPFSAE